MQVECLAFGVVCCRRAYLIDYILRHESEIGSAELSETYVAMSGGAYLVDYESALGLIDSTYADALEDRFGQGTFVGFTALGQCLGWDGTLYSLLDGVDVLDGCGIP